MLIMYDSVIVMLLMQEWYIVLLLFIDVLSLFSYTIVWESGRASNWKESHVKKFLKFLSGVFFRTA